MNIGLLLPYISYPLGKALFDGIITAGKKEGDRIICLLGSLNEKNLGESILKLAENKDLDGLIFYGGGIGQYLNDNEIKALMEPILHKPLLNIGYHIPGVYNLNLDNYTAMKEGILHLIQKHGHRKIAFVAGPEGHPEAIDRLRAYHDCLIENQIKYDPALIIPGGFTKKSGIKAARSLIELLNEKRISAAAFSCDTMASAAVNYLNQEGINLPHDLAIVSFDNSDDAVSVVPGLTTADQMLINQGDRALKIIKNIINGKQKEMDNLSSHQLIFRESCGCLPQFISNVSDPHDVMDISAQNLPLEESLRRHFDKNVLEEMHLTFQSDIQGITRDTFAKKLLQYNPLSSSMHPGYSIRRIHNSISRYRNSAYKNMKQEELKNLEIVLHQFRALVSMQTEYSLTRQRVMGDQLMRSLTSLSNRMISVSSFSEMKSLLDDELKEFPVNACGISLVNYDDPDLEYYLEYLHSKVDYDLDLPLRYSEGRLLHKDLKDLWSKDGTILVLSPLVTDDRFWGILFFAFTDPLSVHDGIYMDALTSQVASSLKQIFLIDERNKALKELRKANRGLESANRKLENLSFRDELTNLYNRRGFMSLASTILDDCRDDGKELMLLFGDLDGLKIINDEFGHEEGDFAILSVAEIIRSVCRDSDIVARLGGDEFIAALPHIPCGFADTLKERLLQAEAELNKNHDKPYLVSCSFGIVLMSHHQDKNLHELMSLADKKLYEEKIKKKGRLKIIL